MPQRRDKNALALGVVLVAVHLVGMAGVAAPQRGGHQAHQQHVQHKARQQRHADLHGDEQHQPGPLIRHGQQHGNGLVAGGQEHRQQGAQADHPAAVEVGGHGGKAALGHAAQHRAGHKAPVAAALQGILDAAAVEPLDVFDQ